MLVRCMKSKNYMGKEMITTGIDDNILRKHSEKQFQLAESEEKKINVTAT